MDESKRKVARPKRGRVDIEMLDPEFRTAMLDGYARAIQAMPQRQKDMILSKLLTK